MNALWPSMHETLFTLAGGPVSLGSILSSVLIVLVALVLTALVTRGSGALLDRRGVDAGVRFAIVKILRYVMLVIGLFVAASSIGIRLDAVIAASAALAVGIGFGLQNIAQNFISGIILLVEQPVRKGDFVRVADASGVVEDVGLRATRVVTRDEVSIIVPNSQFVTQAVVNLTRPTQRLRIKVAVGVAYGTDMDRAREALLTVAKHCDSVLDAPEPEVRLERFGDSSLDLALLVWIESAKDDLRIASDVRFAIERAFRDASITIPFPQRDLHLVPAPAPAPASPAPSAAS
jgi:potassium efflux system protein